MSRDHACPACGHMHPDLNAGDDDAIGRIKQFVRRRKQSTPEWVWDYLRVASRRGFID